VGLLGYGNPVHFGPASFTSPQGHTRQPKNPPY